jgi:hypothetical protein
MTIADDMGDSSATVRCQLSKGHKGLHQEQYSDSTNGTVTITFEKGDIPPVDFKRLTHMIPKGDSCITQDGSKCPFYAYTGELEAEERCYLEGFFHGVYIGNGYKCFTCERDTSK